MVNEPFGSTESTTTYAFGAWNSNFGYPKTVCFFQDRLCFGGNNKRPYMVWMSRSGDYPNFGVEKVSGTVTDDSAIAASFISRKQFDILHLIPSVDLLVLTQGSKRNSQITACYRSFYSQISCICYCTAFSSIKIICSRIFTIFFPRCTILTFLHLKTSSPRSTGNNLPAFSNDNRSSRSCSIVFQI